METIEVNGKTYALMDDDPIIGGDQPTELTGREKMSEFASSRERDRQGRFLSRQAEVDAFFYTPYKVVWRPNPRKRWVLERREELHWHQRVTYIATVIGLGSVLVVLFCRGVAEWVFR